MEQLIKITEKNGKQAVSARELHNFLEIETPFGKWVSRMIKYGFEENIDWTKMSIDNQQVDWALSLDCAKHWSMMQRTEKGMQARNYFIECEKQLNNQLSIMSEAQMILNTLMVVQNQSKAIEAVETRLKAIEQNQSIEIKQDYFSILAYCKRNHIQLSFSEAIQKGKIATKLSKEKGFDLRQIPDERYGYVNSYKDEILNETFQL